ncbi:MAG: hypothetical protein M3468_05390 [Acidobacteriota bacterium]|nr:hypothetical protein [Acidobacteriota bacterium]
MRPTQSGALALLAFVLVSVVCVSGALAQTDSPLVGSRYDPRLQFRVLPTARADIYFHEGEDELARRLARVIAEVAPEVDRRMGGAPSGRLRVILVDQTDVSNGWATVVPYNLIEIVAVPPSGRSIIGNTDDWLRLVFAHEYTHVVHLEKSRGWIGGLRKVFGRLPMLYPNLFLPDWQIEGLATFEESAITRQGRVPAGDFRMLLDEAAAAGRFAPLDRATSAVIDWPGGTSSYLYGAYFHRYLAERFGVETLTRLATATAGRLPFFGSGAFKTVYGRSVGELWGEFQSDTAKRLFARGPGDERTRLTRHGFTVTSPAFTSDGRLFYSVANPHGLPSLRERVSDGTSQHVTSRFHGNRLSAGGGLLVFDQLEFDGHVALFSDLYAYSTDSGQTRRLTRGARAADPDVAPDGKTVVYTVQQSGRRVLATFVIPAAGEAVQPRPLVSEDETEFTSPRWSPDGRTVAAERRRVGGPSEIVLLDVASSAVRTLTTSADGRNISPMWMPDGNSIVFASDRGGGPFTLHRIDLQSGALSRIDAAGAGAQSPTLSPDGAQLVFVGYSADGYDLYSVPADTLNGVPAGALQTAPELPPQPIAADPQPRHVADKPYTPWSTLAPRFWVPFFEADGDDTVLGAATGGFDALGRHTYALSAGWTVPRNRLDGAVNYTYARWWPTLFAGASDDTDSWRLGTVRSREITAGVLLPWRQVRWSSSVLAAASASSDNFDCPDCDEPVAVRRERQAGRLGVNFSTAKAFGYSVSAEEGAALSLITELARGAGGATATSLSAELRGYLRAFPRHAVLAARIAGASSHGDDAVRRDFSASGNGPQFGGFDIGLDAIGLLRGFDSDDLVDRQAAVLNLDYRFPIARPQRGAGTWPFFLRTIHGAAFLDIGHAWDDDFDRGAIRRSLGGELSFDVVLGGAVPLTIATGAAWRHDPRALREGSSFFVRLGRAF